MSPTANDDWRFLPHHRDEDQVAKDVDRSFIYYPKSMYRIAVPEMSSTFMHDISGKGINADKNPDETDQQLDSRKLQLSDVIVQVLRSHPRLNYFQGFHDIAQVFLLVLDDDKNNAARAVGHVSLLRIRDFMLSSLTPSMAHLELLPAILYSVDPKLQQHLSTTKPFFAMASTLTLYAHDIQEYSDIARLFDFLLAQPAVVSLYFFAVIILSRKSELLEVPLEEPEMLHFLLSKLPKPLDLEALMAKTMEVFAEHPPERLPWRSWSRISRFSVLKTTRVPLDRQSISDAEELFARQEDELERKRHWEKRSAQIWKHRWPLGGIGVAVSAIVVSYWLRRNGLDGGLGLGRVWELIKSFRI